MFVGLAVPESRMLFLVLGVLRRTELAHILEHARPLSGEYGGVINAHERHRG